MFDHAPDREGAYDFLESPHVKPDAIAKRVYDAAAARAQGLNYAFVAVDGSALSLTDDNGAKGFGSVGSPNKDVKGLMVMNALAISPDGVPLGLVDQIYWNRSSARETGLTPGERSKRNQQRSFEEKETFFIVEAARHAQERLERHGTKAWVVVDRAADNRDILLALHEMDCLFTIRGRWDRQLWPAEGKSLHETLDCEPSLGTYELHIGRRGQRAARTAKVDVRAAQVTLHFRARGIHEEEALRLFAVRIREKSRNKDAFDWLLYTNVPVLTAEHAQRILGSYQGRWRVEEFHRTWKQGDCNVEDAQLRSMDAVIKWATILAAVATRIERLKYLSRNKPEEPATIEFGEDEIEALQLDQRRRSKTKQRRAPATPTIAEATRWVAQLGGWIGERNGPPGAITLGRGLERLSYLLEGIALARRRGAPDYPT